MVGDKLKLLLSEIEKYQNIPYFSNTGKHQTKSIDNALVGKGTPEEIEQATIKLAQLQNLNPQSFSPIQKRNFQKKNHLGIDCSGLACHLLKIFFNYQLNIRQTSADKLTSAPLSKPIKLNQVKTGDLLRQKNGHHVLFVVNRLGDIINYVHSSRQNRGVKTESLSISKPKIKIDGAYRIISPQSTPDT